MGNFKIQELLKILRDDSIEKPERNFERNDITDIRNITKWNTSRIETFLDRDIHFEFTEEEYHALGYFLFVYPNAPTYNSATIGDAGKKVVCFTRREDSINNEKLKVELEKIRRDMLCN